MSVREEVRRALAPDTEVDKALDILERIVSKDALQAPRDHTAFDLQVTEREDLHMMDRLKDAGLVARTSLNHQVAYSITARGKEVYERSKAPYERSKAPSQIKQSEGW